MVENSKSTVESPQPSRVPREADQKTGDHPKQGLVPRAATLSTSRVAEVAGEIAHEVKTAINGAVEWAEKKADALSKEGEAGVGPYGSPATCVINELDPIASGIMPALEANRSKENKANAEAQKVEEDKTAVEERKK